jgi:hypothetical protein
MAKVKLNFNKRNNWFDAPTGTKKELEDAFEISSNYLYNILYYADKPEIIPQDVLDEERRIFSFCKVGPRAGYFRLDPNSKLVSADVLYMLTSTLPASHIAKKFGMCERKVRAIRRGESSEWYWEYLLIRRLRTIISARLRDPDKSEKYKAYSLSKLVDIDRYEILMYSTGKYKLTRLRKDIISPKEYDKLVETKTLDIIYPINQIDLL